MAPKHRYGPTTERCPIPGQRESRDRLSPERVADAKASLEKWMTTAYSVHGNVPEDHVTFKFMMASLVYEDILTLLNAAEDWAPRPGMRSYRRTPAEGQTDE